MATLTARYPADKLARMRELFFPEERRQEFTTRAVGWREFSALPRSEDRLHRALLAEQS